MFSVRILTVDPSRRDFIRRGVDFYTRRLSQYCDFELLELRSSPVREGGKGAVAEARRRTAELISARLKPEHRLVQLDPRGKTLSSEEFAARIDDWRLNRSGVDFALGGAHGLEHLPGAFRLSLGPWTLPHELARLVVVEGLYRAFTILNGHPYHKG